MKRDFTQPIKRQPRWLSLLALMLLGFLTEVQANTSTFYYKATVSPYPIAGGKVYISNTPTSSPNYQSSQQEVTGSEYTIGYGQRSLYLYANPNDGYLFSHWAKGSVDGAAIAYTDSHTEQIQFDSEIQNNPTTFNYFAVFIAQKGLIKVKSADVTKGTVSIDNPDNGVDPPGQQVTLSANPDTSNGVMFLGWTKDNGTEYISKANPLVLTVSDETKGTYIAHFSEADSKEYVRIQNKMTGKFISFYGNQKASNHTRENRNDGFIFTNSLKLISASDAQGNPETVFLRNGNASGTGVTISSDLTAHGVSYSYLVGNDEYKLTFEKSGDFYRIYTVFKEGENNTMNSYLCDDGGTLVMKTLSGLTEDDQRSAEWYVYFLDENTTEGAFGANAKAGFTKEGKYYTTMYADFAYKCLDGVKAYYLDTQDNLQNLQNGGRVVYFTEVPEGKVPAKTAVVLECAVPQNDFTTDKTVVNRLLPLFAREDGTPSEGSVIGEGQHFLKGHYSINGSFVTNDKSIMYVLSSLNGRLGFYHSSKATMTPNKAYLNTRISPDDYPDAPAVTFTFGKGEAGETNSISTHEVVVNDEDAPVYDLQGRKMTGPLPSGIYVTKGRLFLVK